ncbi:MAG TPA: hypothetical protein VG168_03985 [Bryobacteraceae bacterium]|nr:hypothetical protein [Bryobacteraceae bacterium]
MQQKSWLEELFVQVPAVLEQEEFLDLSTVMQDGTKVRAVASKESFHRRKTLEEHRERARKPYANGRAKPKRARHRTAHQGGSSSQTGGA